MPQTDTEGRIAIKYLQTVPHTISVHGNTYAFVVKRNVNIAWIYPEDVNSVLAIRKECCGGKKSQKYLYANEQDVYWWTQ